MIYRIVCGFVLGLTAVAPGMSGSVAAVMLGIYRQLVEIASNPFKNFKANLRFLLPLGVGAVLSVIVFVAAFAVLFKNYPVPTRCLFLGLVLGGLPALKRDVEFGKATAGQLCGFAVSLVISLGMGILSHFLVRDAAVAPSWYHLAAAGLSGGASAIVPGMSVSVILMVFGVYDFLLEAAASVLTTPLATLAAALPTGIAFVVGLIAFSNVVKWVFKRHNKFAHFAVFGFMCGTIAAVLPDTLPSGLWEWAAAAAAVAVGIGASTLLSKRK